MFINNPNPPDIENSLAVHTSAKKMVESAKTLF